MTFEELDTKAYGMKVTIANRYGKYFGFTKLKKNKFEFNGIVKFFKNSTKEAMSHYQR